MCYAPSLLERLSRRFDDLFSSPPTQSIDNDLSDEHMPALVNKTPEIVDRQLTVPGRNDDLLCGR